MYRNLHALNDKLFHEYGLKIIMFTKKRKTFAKLLITFANYKRETFVVSIQYMPQYSVFPVIEQFSIS